MGLGPLQVVPSFSAGIDFKDAETVKDRKNQDLIGLNSRLRSFFTKFAMIAKITFKSHFLSIFFLTTKHIVASELKDPICHSNECQIGSFSSEATIYNYDLGSLCLGLRAMDPIIRVI